MPASGVAVYMPKTPIWITALGARTPVGLTWESAAAAVRAGISAITEHPRFVHLDGEPMRLLCDSLLDSDLPLNKRMKELLFSSLLQLPNVDLLAGNSVRKLVVLCTPEPRPGLPGEIAESLGRAIMERFGAANLRVRSLPNGHAASILAFGIAAKAIDESEADIAVVASVDSYHDYRTLEWMDDTGQLKSETNRDGFFPGEAAGACLLVRGGQVSALGLEPLARVTAVSTAIEPVPMHRHGEDAVCVGEGLSAAFLALTPAIERDGRTITDTYCDLNGQRYRSEELTYTILRTQHLSADSHNYLHPADCWGDVGAASGALFATLAHAANRKGYAKGSRVALWAGSESGRRAVALLDFAAEKKRAA